MTLHEPSTFLTDLLLSGLCLYLWRKLPAPKSQSGSAGGGYTPGRLHRLSFAVLAASAFTGGMVHGFDQLVDPYAVRLVWNFSQVSGCVWAYLLALSAVAEFRDRRARRFLTLFLTIKLLVMVAVAASDGRFVWVVIESASSLAVTGVISAQRWFKTGAPQYRYTLLGIVLSFAGAAAQVAKVSPAPNFNHNDLFHLILMIAAWCFYRGGSAASELTRPRNPAESLERGNRPH